MISQSSKQFFLFICIILNAEGNYFGLKFFDPCWEYYDWLADYCDTTETTTSTSTTVTPSSQTNATQSTCSCGVAPMGKDYISGGSDALPNEFPWLVRIFGGCMGSCGGSLISPKVVLTALHLLYQRAALNSVISAIETRRVIYGRNYIDHYRINEYDSIPIKEAKQPKREFGSHDFALLVLKTSVTWTPTVSPICLPSPGDDFGGKDAVAAGWGQTHLQSAQSDDLKKVTLQVLPYLSGYNYIRTTVEKNANNEYMDPCSGDSGGPLMYHNLSSGWVLIGTLTGAGYDCRTGGVHGDGLWNNVLTHLDWIKQILMDLKQPICSNDQ